MSCSVLQVWVHGSRYESCLVAVVVPNKNRLEARGSTPGRTCRTGSFGQPPAEMPCCIEPPHWQPVHSQTKDALHPGHLAEQAWAGEQGIDGTFAELCADSCVKRMLLHELEATGKQGGLKVRGAG